MSLRHALLATLFSQPSESVKGRTLLQKKLYFLSILSGEDFGFSPYYYGPYSSKISDQLESLTAAGFVSEVKESLGDAPGPFNEAVRYDYRLSDSGRDVISKRLDEIVTPYSKYLGNINSHGIAENVKLISTAAKVHYIVTEDSRDSVTIGEIQKRAQNLGWDIGQPEIENVVEYLEKLDLVTAG